jgi:hypothetical protein
MMKLRTTLLVSALVALAACGGSTDSASRNRNSLLATTTIPGAVTSTIAGSTTLPGATTVPSATTTGLPVLVPVPTTTSTTSAPTTTLPKVVAEAVAKTFSDIFSTNKRCADGGMCQIGDVGPGGGIVFNVSETGFETPNVAVVNHFVEMAPINRFSDSSLTRIRCSGSLNNKTNISLDVTNALINSCNLRKLVGPRLSDWYLPGAVDLEPIIEFFRKPVATDREGKLNLGVRATTDSLARMQSTFFLTSIPNKCRDIPVDIFYPANPLLQFSGNACYKPSRPGSDGYALAVRSFGSTIRPCATGGPCKTGDVGPRGGIVFAVAQGPGTATTGKPAAFFEALTQPEFLTVGPWCGPIGESLRNLSSKVGFGQKNSETLKNDQWTGLPCDVLLTDFNQESLGYSGGFVPSVDEMRLLCAATKNLKRLDSIAQRQCGISNENLGQGNPNERFRTSRCPIAVVCKENRTGDSSKRAVTTIWTSSSLNGQPLAVSFNGMPGPQPPYALVGQMFNDSRAVSIPFFAFDAILAK